MSNIYPPLTAEELVAKLEDIFPNTPPIKSTDIQRTFYEMGQRCVLIQIYDILEHEEAINHRIAARETGGEISE